MEPRQDTFGPFLQPLLDAPGSRYHLRTNYLDEEKWHPKRYVHEGLIPDLEGHGGPQPLPGSQNNSILILANMTSTRPLRIEYKSGSPSHHKAVDFAHSVRHKSGFQKYGPTRLLMWVHDSEKRPLLPRTVAHRGKISLYLEMVCHVEEVVGNNSAVKQKGARREDALEIESGRQVAKRMEEEHVRTPPERRTQAQDTYFDRSTTSREWHQELQELEQGFKAGKLSQFVGKPPAPYVRPRPGRKAEMPDYSPEHKKLTVLRGILGGQNKAIDKANKVLQKQEEIDRLDLEAHREDIDENTRKEELEMVESKIKDLKNQFETMSTKQLERLTFLDDNRRVFAMDPPLLMWDRRGAEPLVSREDEFYLPKPIALLDFQPKETDEFPMTSDQSMYFDMISTGLFGPGGGTTLKHLNTLAPGAFEALFPQVPALQDPRNGGRRDVESLRVRTFTPEMFYGLAVAWDNWIFKPPMVDTVTQFNMNENLRR
ncbi:hypothetical protein MMC28_005031 [Mycoblastus sanguinarius]|nr:hypothetical protein [Mycoblastus sanguinarius]